MTKRHRKHHATRVSGRNAARRAGQAASSPPASRARRERYALERGADYRSRAASDLRPEQLRRDPSKGLEGFPPNFGDYPIPHVLTFQGLIGTIAKIYRPSDEAVMDSWDNARYMLNDLGIMECLEQRKRSVALLDWRIEPENPKDSRQKELAATMTDVLKATPFFTKYRECLQNALWFGKYGVKHRFRWKWIKGQKRLIVDHWEPIHGDKIVFRYDDGTKDYDPDQIGIRVGAGFTSNAGVAQRWSQNRLDKVQVADYGLAYFLDPWERPLVALHKHIIEDGEYEVPMAAGRIHGIGIRHRIYWSWFQKQELLAFLMEFLERSSTGIEIWYYPYGNKEAEEKTRAAAQERIGQGRNIILVPRPIGEEAAYGVERIEPGMAGAEALKDIIKSFYFDQIKRYILGQTLTTEAASTGLGSNLASVHLDTYLQIVRYDATNQEESITRETLQPLQRFNCPAQADVPLFFKLNTESPDVEGKLKAWREAWDMGARLKASQVMDLIGAETADGEDEVLQNPQAAQAKAMASAGELQGRPTQVRGFRPKTAEEDTADLMRALGIPDAAGENGAGRGKTPPTGEGSAESATNGDTRSRPDPLPGGVGDDTDPATLPREALKLGTREEMEHTADPAVAMEIAIDHLTEDPHYYDDVAATPENSERSRPVRYCMADEGDEISFALTLGRHLGRRETIYVLHPVAGEVEKYVATAGGVSHEKYVTQRSFEWHEDEHPRKDDGQFAPKGEGQGHRKTESKPMPSGPSDIEESKYQEYKTVMEAHGITPRSFDLWAANYRQVRGKQQAKSEEAHQEKVKAEPTETLPEPSKAEDEHDNSDETPGRSETPRQTAQRVFEDQQSTQYAFARRSDVPNAGEDLLGSARHRANAWRGLEEAEEEGTAEKLVTREQLLRNEPHNLQVSAPGNPLTTLAMYYVLRAFPPTPGYGKHKATGEDAKKVRRQYLEAYRSIKEKVESLAASDEQDPRVAIEAVREHVAKLINDFRGQKGNDSLAIATASDRYNETANALCRLHKACGVYRDGSIARGMKEFMAAFLKKYQGEAKLPADRVVETTAAHVADILDGASVNKTFDTVEHGKKRFNPADVYVKTASRKGGPAVAAETPSQAKKYLLDHLKMRGVQFGNYVTDDERQHHLQKCSEALADLADILDVPVDYLSWKGKLGIAFGARGHGNASAHYEPTSAVINLTRASGAGSLAHEWGHFFDHAIAGFGVNERCFLSQHVSPKRHEKNDKGEWVPVDNSGDPMWKAMEAVRKAWRSSGFYERLRKATYEAVKDDRLGKDRREYFMADEEIFARCFERHVQRRLERAGRQNTYLAGTLPLSYEEGKMPFWPNDSEMDAMAEAFDGLLGSFRDGVKTQRYSLHESGRLVVNVEPKL